LHCVASVYLITEERWWCYFMLCN